MKIKRKRYFSEKREYWDLSIPKNHNYILSNGCVVHNCGVGFSVERQFINKLPDIPDELYQTDTTIVVADSKLGWAKALNELISLLYTGLIPEINLTKIRPAGSILKTFGGRASGPAPLDKLFKFVIDKFQQNKGNKLTSIDCHDVACMIGNIVVVGGVRRSALISLSNLSDERMRHAKTGQWWLTTPYRSLANNSAVYTDKQPEMATFMIEWKSLYDSKSGERGIFSRYASRNIINYSNKLRKEWYGDNCRLRDIEYDSWGCNPCLTGDTWILTSEGHRQIKDLIGVPFKAIVCGKEYNSVGFFKTGEKEVFKIETFRGYSVKATSNHVMITTDGEVEVKDLTSDHELVLNLNVGNKIIDDKYLFNLGWLVGEVVGDGSHNPEKYHTKVCFWGEEKYHMATLAQSIISSIEQNYFSPIPQSKFCESNHHDTCSISTRKLTELCEKYLEPLTKEFKNSIIEEDESFIKGFIRGFFDTDGSVQGSFEKGISVRLGQTSRQKLEAIQLLLSRFGILSTLYTRGCEGETFMPDGKGGYKFYPKQQFYELKISRSSIDIYEEVIGFYKPSKANKLKDLLSKKKKASYQDKTKSQVCSVISCGVEEVYDCAVDQIHRFDANGIIVHNCSEIILRDKQGCNLTEAIVRADDIPSTLKEKVKVATILGTFQSTLTNFKFLSKTWKKNFDDERLLGVSLTGIMDNPLLNTVSKGTINLLTELRKTAIETNMEWAKKLGIPQSTAVTCTKPSGTVSALNDTSSGIHSRHAPYYLRSVRSDKKDPVAQLMIDQGVYVEDDMMHPNDNYVFYFPMKAPEGAVFRKDIDAIKQLEIWKMYQQFYTEHKPSITVSVREEEWMKVGAWVYENFEWMSGVSFLPFADHSYQQAPFQDLTEEQYSEWYEKTPKSIDWGRLPEYENDDKTTGSQELSCSSGNCEL